MPEPSGFPPVPNQPPKPIPCATKTESIEETTAQLEPKAAQAIFTEPETADGEIEA